MLAALLQMGGRFVSLRVLALFFVGLFVVAPAPAIAQVTPDYILAQCSVAIADRRTNWKPNLLGDNFDEGIRIDATVVAGMGRETLIERLAEQEAYLADVRAYMRSLPDYRSIESETVKQICMFRTALSASGGGSPKPSSPAPAKSTPSPPPASSQPAPRTGPKAPDSTLEARLAGVLDEELDRFESQAELDIASPTPPRPATPAPTGPGPHLIVQQNEGTPCLEASLAGIHRTSPPQPNAEDNYWYYDIVLRNKCAYSVVWYSEIFTGPAPPPSYSSSNLGPFIYGGAGWPVWGTKPSPASPDYRPVETFINVPLSPGEVKQAPGAQKVVDLQPVQLWLLSCDAYATDGQRAMTMFNTGAPLSRDRRFFCTPNVTPAVRY